MRLSNYVAACGTLVLKGAKTLCMANCQFPQFSEFAMHRLEVIDQSQYAPWQGAAGMLEAS
jgi:hypothetical protein